MTAYKPGEIYGARWRNVNDTTETFVYYKFRCMSEQFPMLIESVLASVPKRFFIDASGSVFNVHTHSFTNKHGATETVKYTQASKPCAKLLDIRQVCEMCKDQSYTAVVGSKNIHYRCVSNLTPTEIRINIDGETVTAFIDQFGNVYQAEMQVFTSLYDENEKTIEYVPGDKLLFEGTIMYIQQV